MTIGAVMDTPMFAVEDVPHVLSLAEKFTVPPFSILNAAEGWWQTRKNQWKDLGIKSEVGRDARAYGNNGDDSFLGKQIDSIAGGISIFDPVLTELAYRWFCPPGGTIIDPFTGGSVRGVVAAYLGYQYHGVDLSERQVNANFDNLTEMERDGIKFPGTVHWTAGDSLVTVPRVAAPESKDFLFSCPPYFDLEVYSDGPEDISAMTWEEFLDTYRQIIAVACETLKPDRMAAWVIGEIRDKKTGYYRNFMGETIRAFQDAGMEYYNEMVLATPVGSVAMMVSRQFEATRKIGKRHQTMLTFVKGNPRVVAGMMEKK